MESFIGSEEEVLFEGFETQENINFGFTTRYLKARSLLSKDFSGEVKRVKIMDIKKEKEGFFAECRITK